MKRFAPLVLTAVVALGGCRESAAPEPARGAAATRPSILLVTLDTTRADAIGPDAGNTTPAFNALAHRGTTFRQAYATAPQTLPSHASMFTGLYPAGHRVHENGRFLADEQPVVTERLRDAGYRTAAFVSAFPLARRFGLARAFETYDDEFAEERSAQQTTDRAVAWLAQQDARPLFLWVHYFDPHYPYQPPPEFRRGETAREAYRGEVAAMDAQLGRLVTAFEQRTGGPAAIIVAADHGEGLGDHGEAQHGHLLYQSVMRVPMLIAGPGVNAGTVDSPVSTRRIFHTILDFAGLGADQSLRAAHDEVVVGEAMVPFLQYGWQPQVMAVEGRRKAIHAGAIEVYDVVADPAETRDVAATADLSRGMRAAIREYPIPSANAPAPPGPVDEEARRRLASLGYIASDVKPVVRPDAPRPRDMVHLLDELERASAFIDRGDYARAVPLLEQILEADPHNLASALRLGAAHSALGNDERALNAYRRAEAMAPDSADVRHYLALHYARGADWQRAVPMLERVVAESPDRVPALEALASLRERQGRLEDALSLRQRIAALKAPTPAELTRLGQLAMALGRTPLAIESFERARTAGGDAFQHHLELGALYLASRRYEEARQSLDRVSRSHPAYPMAAFKRAQVSVLLNEPDRGMRIDAARRHADDTTRELIARERLFQQ